MKTTDPRDPLDIKIDNLLANRPVTASDDFASRVLAAAEQEEQHQPNAADSKPSGILLRFALPIAALLLIAFTLAQFIPNGASINQPQTQTAANTTIDTKPTTTFPAEAITLATDSTALSTTDMQEIFLLEEGLAGLTQLQDESLDATDLLSTLDALTFEI